MGATASSDQPPPPTPAPAPRLSDPPPTGPLALWLLLQLAPLALAAFQVPLSDQYPRPPERLALDLLLVAQIVFSSLLCPLLFRSWSQSVLVVASTWPLAQLAGFLAATPPSRVVAVSLYVTGWLLLLALWVTHLRARRAQHLLATIASSLALLGPLLWYLRAEFGPSGPPFASHLTRLAPALSALSVLHAAQTPLAPFLALLGALSLSLLLAWTTLRRAPRPSGPASETLSEPA